MSKSKNTAASSKTNTKIQEPLKIIEPPGSFFERLRKINELFDSLSLDPNKPEHKFNVITLAVEPGEFAWLNQAFNISLSALALDKPEIKNFVKWFCFWKFNYNAIEYASREKFQEHITKDLVEQTQIGQPLAIALDAFKRYIKLSGSIAPVTDEQVLQLITEMDK